MGTRRKGRLKGGGWTALSTTCHRRDYQAKCIKLGWLEVTTPEHPPHIKVGIDADYDDDDILQITYHVILTSSSLSSAYQ